MKRNCRKSPIRIVGGARCNWPSETRIKKTDSRLKRKLLISTDNVSLLITFNISFNCSINE